MLYLSIEFKPRVFAVFLLNWILYYYRCVHFHKYFHQNFRFGTAQCVMQNPDLIDIRSESVEIISAEMELLETNSILFYFLQIKRIELWSKWIRLNFTDNRSAYHCFWNKIFIGWFGVIVSCSTEFKYTLFQLTEQKCCERKSSKHLLHIS